jgi:hypothetical protein
MNPESSASMTTTTKSSSEEPRDTDEKNDSPAKLRDVAEIRKINLEASEIEMRLSRGRHSPRFVFEAILGGVVAAGLLAAWLIGYLKPVLSAESELADIKAQIYQQEVALLKVEKKGLKSQQEQVRADNEKIQHQRDQLIAQNQQLGEDQRLVQKRIAELRKQLSRLVSEVDSFSAKSQLNQSDHNRLQQVTQDTEEQIGRLQHQSDTARSVESAAIRRIEALTAQRDATLLADYEITIRAGHGEQAYAEELREALERFNMDITIDEDTPPYDNSNVLITPTAENPRIVTTLKRILEDFDLQHKELDLSEGTGWAIIFP